MCLDRLLRNRLNGTGEDAQSGSLCLFCLLIEACPEWMSIPIQYPLGVRHQSENPPRWIADACNLINRPVDVGAISERDLIVGCERFKRGMAFGNQSPFAMGNRVEDFAIKLGKSLCPDAT